MNFILGVTGSISAYKALDICRGLTKLGHNVKVVMTRGALEFVQPNTFHYLGALKVYTPNDDFNLNAYDDSTNVLHIDLVKWADKLIIAPASANTIAKLSNGFCDDLLSSIFLALGKKTCIIYPAMNTQMLSHPMTVENLSRLNKLENIFIHPTAAGELACGDQGLGKLASVETIIDTSICISLISNQKNVLITTGATISPLDPVRYITNPSSGKTGYELAKNFLAQGFKVTLIYGYNTIKEIQNLKEIPHCTLVNAKTTKEMKLEVEKNFDQCDLYISTAAMSDIEFTMTDQKIKKDSMSNTLEYSQAPDILAQMLSRKKHQKIIGFAAETTTSQEIFLEKWKRKPVDLLIGNLVNNGVQSDLQGFNTNSNEYFFIKNGQIFDKAKLSKTELSNYIVRESHD